MALTDIRIDDKYRQERGRVFLNGVQALARAPMLQYERDLAAGLHTAGYVSGYRGSPLGGLDTALHEAKEFLAAHEIRFRPGLNEDLAATAIWGTQQLHLLPGAKRDGVFAMWYGKGPGVDRCGDVFKHANHAGTAAHGGVLVVAGDDHAARSSAVAHQSEHIFSACGIPVLAPTGVQEIIDFALHGWAMSRYTGCWVALKLSADIVESSATALIDPARVQPQIPDDFALPPDGVHIRWPDPQPAQEHRMQAFKIYAAAAYARANGLNRIVFDSPRARLGLVACGKAWLDLREALRQLGIGEAQAAALGLRVYKVGMPWPLEADGVRRFATGLEEILVVEEKRQIIEYQLKEMLYNWREDVRPRVVGKFDHEGEWPAPHGKWLLPPTGELTPAIVARAIAARLERLDTSAPWRSLADALTPELAARPGGTLQRAPYFCSGCPHNRSTRVPEGSCAFAGVGCHLMAMWMERSTLTVSQMGGEGVNWIGMAEHAGPPHMFANMGDGTYFHSGLLAIRAAVAAGVNITYKLLYNDAVAMTGGQPVDGPLTVPQMTRQLAAEGVEQIVVLAEEGRTYPPADALAPGVRMLPHDQLDAVQRELRGVSGVTALIYDQVCATEARRRRKRGKLPAAKGHVFINEAVCEGCGDCGIKSNCLSVVPVQTEFGTKRAIDQFTCNLDLACLAGHCPALVTVEGATLKRGQGLAVGDQDELPEPQLPDLAQPYSLLIAGVGGTGVVTLGALLGMAAHLEGKAVTVLDQSGLAQKGGAVLTHVRLARSQDELHAPRIVHADVLLGCDMLVAAGADALPRLVRGRTRAVINTAETITGDILRHPELGFPREQTLALLREALVDADELDATRLASLLAGHSIATNMFMLGFAWQRGWVPISRAALMRSIELNAVSVADNQLAFEWGRRAAWDSKETARLAGEAESLPASRRLSTDLAEVIARRRELLVAYQDEAYAQRYARLVDQVRTAEQAAVPGSTRLAETVARNAYRLMARKDEYEVARLFADAGFSQALHANFEGDFEVRVHLAPPLFSRPDPVTGEDRKRSYGPWMLRVLRLLSKGKVLRGTPLDVFGYTALRRMERALSEEYERTVRNLIKNLRADNHQLACEIADVPDRIRGFGVVKQRNARTARERQLELMSAWSRQPGVQSASNIQP